MDDNARRLMLLFASEDVMFQAIAVFSCLGKTGKLPDKLLIPDFSNVPEDAVVLGVQHDYSRDGFVFKLRHPSFGIVPTGGHIPFVDNTEEILVEANKKCES